jgi:hypothetical protein
MALPVRAPLYRPPCGTKACPCRRDAGGGDIFVEVKFQIVVTGDLVLLAAFLVQTHLAAPALDKIIPHLHFQHVVDAREAVHHDGDESAIAQADEGGFEPFRLTIGRRISHDRDAVEELAGLLGRQHRRLAFFHDVFGAAHGVSRVYVDDVADDRQSNSMRSAARCCFTVGGVNWLSSFLMNAAMWKGSTAASSRMPRRSHHVAKRRLAFM